MQKKANKVRFKIKNYIIKKSKKLTKLIQEVIMYK